MKLDSEQQIEALERFRTIITNLIEPARRMKQTGIENPSIYKAITSMYNIIEYYLNSVKIENPENQVVEYIDKCNSSLMRLCFEMLSISVSEKLRGKNIPDWKDYHALRYSWFDWN